MTQANCPGPHAPFNIRLFRDGAKMALGAMRPDLEFVSAHVVHGTAANETVVQILVTRPGINPSDAVAYSRWTQGKYADENILDRQPLPTVDLATFMVGMAVAEVDRKAQEVKPSPDALVTVATALERAATLIDWCALEMSRRGACTGPECREKAAAYRMLARRNGSWFSEEAASHEH